MMTHSVCPTPLPPSPPPTALSHTCYTVGWFCVLSAEQDAARALLDEEHKNLPMRKDDNCYILGSMAGHNIVIVRPTRDGRIHTNEAAVRMLDSFPKIRFALLVGIAGGATSAPDLCGFDRDILLGDVVVSRPQKDHGGVWQYDTGAELPDGLEIRSHLNSSSSILIKASKALESNHNYRKGKMAQYREAAIEKLDRKMYSFPGREHDLLFQTSYHHVPGTGRETKNRCVLCDRTQVITKREERMDPVVHYGLVATADRVMKSGELRDQMSRGPREVLCFEMEAAGLVNHLPSIAICGIADYADTHKNKRWQPYAAVTAAAYAKDLLAMITPEAVEESEVAQFKSTMDRIEADLNTTRRIEILEWLCRANFLSERRDLVSTGQWLIESDEFKHWVGGRRWQLRCYGEAGTGKTSLCAVVAKHLKTTFPSRPVICIYLKGQPEMQEKQTPKNIFGSLVRQLLQFDSVQMPPRLRDAHKSQTEETEETERLFKEVFEELLQQHDRTYLILDGLNNCSDEVRKVVKLYLREIARDEPRISILTTALGYPETTAVVECSLCRKPNLNVYFSCACKTCNFDICFECKQAGCTCDVHQSHDETEPYAKVRIEVRAREEELELYCRTRLSRASEDRRDKRVHPPPRNLARYLLDKPDLKDRIAQEIARKAQGKFLFAEAWIDTLNNLHLNEPDDDEQLLRLLDRLPVDALESYCKNRIETIRLYTATDARIAFDAISFLISARRPPTLLALQYALALTSQFGLLSKATLYRRNSIVRASNGLIAIDKGDEHSSYVRFVHPTFAVLLDKSDKDNDPRLTNADSTTASICLKYFDHPEFPAHCSRLSKYPFLAYALEFWGDHVREAAVRDGDARVLKETWRFLQDPDSVAGLVHATAQLACQDAERSPNLIGEGATALHICAWFGLSDLLEKLCTKDEDINLTGTGNVSPLQYACVKGHRDTVSRILKIPNVRVDDVALAAAIYGIPSVSCSDEEQKQETRVDIVKKLLGTGKVNINGRIGLKKRTPLMFSVRRGRDAIVESLLEEKGLEINAQDADGHTALWYAVYASSRMQGSWADSSSHESHHLVQLLLKHGADPHVKDCTGRTVLALSVAVGDSSTLILLLQSDQSKRKAEKNLIHLAAASGHPEVIRILFASIVNKTGVAPNLNALDANGLTALHYASLSRSQCGAEVAATLLALHADANTTDTLGCSPYTAASLLQRPEVMKVFEGRASMTCQQKKSTKDLPALSLANAGHWALIRELIASKRADVTYKDISTGETLLHIAAHEDRLDVMRALLAAHDHRKRLISQVDHRGRTPLHFVNSVEGAALLIQHGCSPLVADIDDRTASTEAYMHTELMCYLEEAERRGRRQPAVVDVHNRHGRFWGKLPIGQSRLRSITLYFQISIFCLTMIYFVLSTQAGVQ